VINAIDVQHDTDRALLQTANNALVTAHISEANEQFINRYYFDFAGGRYPYATTSAELNQIKQLAESCPEEHGAAVLKAREVLFALTLESQEYLGQCVQPRSVGGQSEPAKQTMEAVASPNPAHDAIVFTASSPLRQVSISNTLGVRVPAYTSVSGKSATLDITPLPIGMYFAELQSSTGEKVTLSFVKQ
jgi:Secretion system C-terminal sorting domain